MVRCLLDGDFFFFEEVTTVVLCSEDTMIWFDLFVGMFVAL